MRWSPCGKLQGSAHYTAAYWKQNQVHPHDTGKNGPQYSTISLQSSRTHLRQLHIFKASLPVVFLDASYYTNDIYILLLFNLQNYFSASVLISIVVIHVNAMLANSLQHVFMCSCVHCERVQGGVSPDLSGPSVRVETAV